MCFWFQITCPFYLAIVQFCLFVVVYSYKDNLTSEIL